MQDRVEPKTLKSFFKSTNDLYKFIIIPVFIRWYPIDEGSRNYPIFKSPNTFFLYLVQLKVRSPSNEHFANFSFPCAIWSLLPSFLLPQISMSFLHDYLLLLTHVQTTSVHLLLLPIL